MPVDMTIVPNHTRGFIPGLLFQVLLPIYTDPPLGTPPINNHFTYLVFFFKKVKFLTFPGRPRGEPEGSQGYY